MSVLILMYGENVWLALGVVVVYRGFAGFDALRVARAGAPHRMNLFVRWPVYAASAVLLTLGNIGVALIVRAHVAEAFHVPTMSMSHTIESGDRFLAEKLAFDPRRGDVVVYKVHFEGKMVNFVQRVVGLPGERVEVRGDKVHIDGKPLDEDYVRLDGYASEDYGPAVVPEQSYLLLGDRRQSSRDGRMLGFTSRDRIFARARVIFWSEDSDGAVRWHCVGMRIR